MNLTETRPTAHLKEYRDDSDRLVAIAWGNFEHDQEKTACLPEVGWLQDSRNQWCNLEQLTYLRSRALEM